MACNLSHTVEEIKQGVEKLIEGDPIRKEKIIDIAENLTKTSTAKDDLIKQYERCFEIPLKIFVAVEKF